MERGHQENFATGKARLSPSEPRFLKAWQLYLPGMLGIVAMSSSGRRWACADAGAVLRIRQKGGSITNLGGRMT